MFKNLFCRTKTRLLSLGIVGIMVLNLGIAPISAMARSPDDSFEEVKPENFLQVVISLAEGTNLDWVAEEFKAQIIRRGPLNFATLEFSGKDMQEIIAKLKETPGIIGAEENYLRTIQGRPESSPPQDPLFMQQWSLISRDVPGAWEMGANGQGVIIAFVDTGIALEHPDLRANIVPGYNSITGSEVVGANQDNNGHGTEVAGIAAAEKNEVGIVGVAYQAKIMPVKAIGAKGLGYDDAIADGIIWAANHGANIINLSLGSEKGSVPSDILKQAVTYAYDKGCLLIAASGNYDRESQGNPGVSYPASDPRVLAVTATDNTGKITDYSATGIEVDLAAPGDSIPTDGWNRGEGFSYTYASGTSVAAPFVSGEAALIWSLHPEWSRDRVVQALEEGTEDLGLKGRDDDYGYGLVNVKYALTFTNQTLDIKTSPAVVDAYGGVVEAIRDWVNCYLLQLNSPRKVKNLSHASDLPSQ